MQRSRTPRISAICVADSWALELCDQLLGTRAAPAGQHWNIANAVEVVDVSGKQAAFEAHFLKNYDHGSWRMTRTRPEALIKDWLPEMSFTSSDFRAVERRSDWKGAFAKILFDLCCSKR